MNAIHKHNEEDIKNDTEIEGMANTANREHTEGTVHTMDAVSAGKLPPFDDYTEITAEITPFP